MRRGLFRLNKKGISPLIATVLLIAFAVALGAVVMNWGKNYVVTTATDAQRSGQAKQKCTGTNMEFVMVSGIPKMCVDHITNASSVQFILKNKASDEIVDIEMTVLGDTDAVNMSLKSYFISINNSKFPLSPNKILIAKNVNISGVGEFEKIIFTPYIKVDGKKDPEACSDNTLNVDANEVYECS